MNLLPDELRHQLPHLHSQQDDPNPIVYIRFYTPDFSSTWWVTEGSFEADDFRFFGYVRGPEERWKYFLLSELEQARDSEGRSVERDLDFEPGLFSDVVPAPED